MNATLTYSPMSPANYIAHAATGIAVVGLWYWLLCSASAINDSRYAHVPCIFRPIAMAGCDCFKERRRYGRQVERVCHQNNLV